VLQRRRRREVKPRVDGEKLRVVRHQKLMPRKELVEKSGVGYTTIWKMEQQNYTPSLTTLRKIAKALKVDPYEFIDFKELAGVA
jgi:transcriptional regulator with XRE-family HTH domain